MSSYRYQATSVEGFVQMLACNLLPHGYWHYVCGVVPEGKDPLLVDQKLIDKYGVAVSKQGRVRRKRAGLANLHYLRFERFWILLATHGAHLFFEREEANIRDVRRVPIKFKNYSISVKQGGHLRKDDPNGRAEPDPRLRARVQIARDRYLELKAWFLDIATRRSAKSIGAELFRVPFEPYAPIRQQMLNILRLVNRARKEAGLDRVPPSCLRYHRRIVKPFEPELARRPLLEDRRADAEAVKIAHVVDVEPKKTDEGLG